MSVELGGRNCDGGKGDFTIAIHEYEDWELGHDWKNLDDVDSKEMLIKTRSETITVILFRKAKGVD